MCKMNRAFSTLMMGTLLGLLAAGCSGTRDPGPVAREIHQGWFATNQQEARSPAVAPDSLIIVSYNIEYALESELAAAELLAHPQLQQVDILLLQEMDPQGSEYLARELGMDYVHAPAYVHPRHGRRYGTTVLSRWPITDFRSVVLPHPNPFSSNHRRAAAADVQLGPRRLRVVSVHLSTLVIPLEDRLEQVDVLCDSLAQVDFPIIIGGDFNTVSTEGRREVRQHMRHCGFRQVRLPEGQTARSGAMEFLDHDLVLDYFFYRGLKPSRSGIGNQFTASDHYPVWAVFRWPSDIPAQRKPAKP
jgi:endonuclease/exonuclease/phosphatase family metal-dependent hydrolase